MGKLILPEFLDEKLASSPYRSEIISALDICSEYYGDETRGLPLFPEYTGHRTDHVQSVINAAEWLLDDSCRELISANDIAFLIGSILLHDAAMLLTEDGFLTLLKADASPVVSSLDKSSWKDLWNAFYFKAKRWDTKKLFQNVN
jgi:hypothetical protein